MKMRWSYARETSSTSWKSVTTDGLSEHRRYKIQTKIYLEAKSNSLSRLNCQYELAKVFWQRKKKPLICYDHVSCIVITYYIRQCSYDYFIWVIFKGNCIKFILSDNKIALLPKRNFLDLRKMYKLDQSTAFTTSCNWLYSMCILQRSGIFGTFPGNYVAKA